MGTLTRVAWPSSISALEPLVGRTHDLSYYSYKIVCVITSLYAILFRPNYFNSGLLPNCAYIAAVVANLWDVTDGDIDRFTATLLDKMQLAAHQRIPNAVNDARQSCVLKYLVGAAPVVYGLPIAFS